jgi:hypothetical protein
MTMPDPSPIAQTSATEVADPVRSSRYQPRATMWRPEPAIESTCPTKYSRKSLSPSGANGFTSLH